MSISTQPPPPDDDTAIDWGIGWRDEAPTMPDVLDDAPETVRVPPVLAIAFAVALCAAGCGYGKAACAVVDITKVAADDAQRACNAVIRYMGPDGRVHEETVPTTELVRLGERQRAARLEAERAR